MTKYYGVICDPLLKDMEVITTDKFDFKPGTETIGDIFGTVCHWFTEPDKMLDFIEYGIENLGFCLNNPKEMVEIIS